MPFINVHAPGLGDTPRIKLATSLDVFVKSILQLSEFILGAFLYCKEKSCSLIS